MPNLTGVNGWGDKKYPRDDILCDYFHKLALLPLTVEDKILRLKLEFDLDIKKTKFYSLQNKFKVPSVRKPYLPPNILENAVIDQIHHDINGMNGPKTIKSILKDKGCFVARERVHQIMRTHAPEGFLHRHPQVNKKKIQRTPLTYSGPFREISADGHEKLNSQALKMGDISLPIYGYRDKWSGCILKLCILPNSRDAGAIGHLFLDLISEYGGIPIQVTTDKGSEIGWQCGIQTAFRRACTPDLDEDIYPPLVTVKSTRNIVIESLWKWLRLKIGFNLKDIILRGKNEGIIQYYCESHVWLFYWIFTPVIQQKLDEFRTYWNQHKIRPQAKKILPSGHAPIDALQNYKAYDVRSLLITVPEEAQVCMRGCLEEDVGSREQHLNWPFPADFDRAAGLAYSAVGSPQITLMSAWNVFTLMLDRLNI